MCYEAGLRRSQTGALFEPVQTISERCVAQVPDWQAIHDGRITRETALWAGRYEPHRVYHGALHAILITSNTGPHHARTPGA